MTDTRATPIWAWLAAAALVVVFMLQAHWAARRDSVTIDEFVHLPVGLYSIYTGDFRPDPINPPHTRMIAALGLLGSPPAFNPEVGTPHWGMGYTLMQKNTEDYQEIFVRGRSMIILVSVLLALLVGWWARRLYGWQSGLAALALFAFSPTMLAHGHLVTLDQAGAFGFALTAFAVWRLFERPSLLGAAAVGLALGIATLLKLSGFVLVAAVVVLFALRAVLERRPGEPSFGRWFALLCTAGLATVFTINAGYVFDGTFALLADATLADGGMFAGWAEAAPWLRLPFPLPFINGVDMILNVGKTSEPSYFLWGELSAEGWPYYHLAAFVMKTPLFLLCLFGVAIAGWTAGRSGGVREYCLFVPIAMLFASNSAFNSLQIGVRHVLSVYPLVIVASAPWLAAGIVRAVRSAQRRKFDLAGTLTAVGLVWFIGSTLFVGPRYLQFFNIASGGASGGHENLVDSNIDWGQDLIRLAEYIEAEELPGINLAYFGRVHPAVYGVRFVPLESERQSGPTAISASFLMGRPYFWYKRGRMGWVAHETYAWLREHEPVARAGSMFIYDLPPYADRGTAGDSAK